MDIAYPNIAERLFGRPHAIEPFALRAIMDGPLARRILAGDGLDAKQTKKGRNIRRDRLAAIVGAEEVRSPDGIVDYGLTAEGIAVIPVAGVLSRRFDWLAAACGWTTYEGLGATLDAALDDYRVKAILFDVDSPGGEADGMLDMADAILVARAQKPVWAVANTLAASAAYAMAGSAQRLVLPRIAEVGSIGCVMVHVDQSAADKAYGLTYSAIYSGARKIDGWAHAPLSDGARSSAQAGCDHVRNEFAALVGRQGRIDAAAAMATEAAMFADDAAVSAGLADEVGTFADALAALTAQVSPSFKGVRTMKTKPVAAALKPEEPAAVVEPVAEPVAQPAPAAEAADATKAADTPPAPGETCKLCGQVMPDDGDKDAKKGAEKGAVADPAPAAAASAPAYGDAEVNKTLDLCKLAGASLSVAQAFIKAKTPIAAVSEQLLATRAAASDGLGLVRAVNSGDGDGSQSGEARLASWRETQKKVKAELGIGK